jgi:putative two-component system response regulator
MDGETTPARGREASEARVGPAAAIARLLGLFEATEIRDQETGGHVRRLSHYAYVLARGFGLDDDEARLVADAAPLHDIGKLAVAGHVLHKPGPLDAAEWREMREHPSLGALLLRPDGSKLVATARAIALTHHERWDGSGYPHGLVGDETPVAGRIVMLADQYDALRSERCYKPAFDHETTVAILLEGDGRSEPAHFDPRLLGVLRELEGALAEIHERIAD